MTRDKIENKESQYNTTAQNQADASASAQASERGKEEIQQNKMGYMPCGRLLLTMALPMMLSMLVQALYNIVDSIFVARISEEALTAVSLAFPLQMLLIAVSGGTGVGVNSRLSAKLGERSFEEVNLTAGNALTLSLIFSIIMMSLGTLFSGTYFGMMTQDAAIIRHGSDYLFYIMLFSPALFFQMTLERLLQSTGKTFYSMITQTTGAVINIILDPVLIFGLAGVPALGTKGAAIATVFGQFVACMLALYFNIRFNTELKLARRYLHLKRNVVAQIFAVGLPSIIMQSIGSIMNLGMNKILLSFTATAAAVFGVYFKLQSFVFMPVFGLNNGVVPIMAFNYGARKADRIKETFRYGALYAVIIMAVGTVIFELFPERLLSMFSASENMLQIGIPALRIIAAHFLLAGVSIVCMSAFQALGHGMLSLWVSLIRQLIVLLPCAFILSKAVGLDGVWLAFPAAEVVSLTVSLTFIKRIVFRQIDAM